jgi:dTDP-4-dehydrorhamnose reductase
MILVTGASGYIGRYIRLFQPSHLPVIYQVHQNPLSLPDEISFDLRNDFDDIFQDKKIDCIIHLAAMSRMNDCEQDRPNAWAVNVQGSSRLVLLAQKHNSRFIYLSTDLVFDGEVGQYDETASPAPINYYGKTKRHAEILIQQLDNFVIARSALVFGAPVGNKKNFTTQIIENVRAGSPVPVFYDEYRSPIWVEDLAKAIWQLVENDFRGILHLAGPQDLSRAEMAEIVCEAYHLDKSLLQPRSSDEFAFLARRPKNCTLRSLYKENIFNFTFSSFQKIASEKKLD